MREQNRTSHLRLGPSDLVRLFRWDLSLQSYHAALSANSLELPGFQRVELHFDSKACGYMEGPNWIIVHLLTIKTDPICQFALAAGRHRPVNLERLLECFPYVAKKNSLRVSLSKSEKFTMELDIDSEKSAVLDGWRQERNEHLDRLHSDEVIPLREKVSDLEQQLRELRRRTCPVMSEPAGKHRNIQISVRQQLLDTEAVLFEKESEDAERRKKMIDYDIARLFEMEFGAI